MAEQRFGGYDFKTTWEKTPPELVCLICHVLLKKATELPCSHVYCQDCLLKWEEKKLEESKEGEFQCSLCKKVYQQDEKQPSRFLDRIITTEIDVLCQQHKLGCQWVGTINDFQEHHLLCDHREMSCRFNGCDVRIQIGNLTEHEKNCPNRLVAGAYFEEAKKVCDMEVTIEKKLVEESLINDIVQDKQQQIKIGSSDTKVNVGANSEKEPPIKIVNKEQRQSEVCIYDSKATVEDNLEEESPINEIVQVKQHQIKIGSSDTNVIVGANSEKEPPIKIVNKEQRQSEVCIYDSKVTVGANSEKEPPINKIVNLEQRQTEVCIYDSKVTVGDGLEEESLINKIVQAKQHQIKIGSSDTKVTGGAILKNDSPINKIVKLEQRHYKMTVGDNLEEESPINGIVQVKQHQIKIGSSDTKVTVGDNLEKESPINEVSQVKQRQYEDIRTDKKVSVGVSLQEESPNDEMAQVEPHQYEARSSDTKVTYGYALLTKNIEESEKRHGKTANDYVLPEIRRLKIPIMCFNNDWKKPDIIDTEDLVQQDLMYALIAHNCTPINSNANENKLENVSSCIKNHSSSE